MEGGKERQREIESMRKTETETGINTSTACSCDADAPTQSHKSSYIFHISERHFCNSPLVLRPHAAACESRSSRVG